MSEAWDDFREPSRDTGPKDRSESARKDDTGKDSQDVCDWGFSRKETQVEDGEVADPSSDSYKFVPVYEKYLEDKQSFSCETKNYNMYRSNPERAMREWFDNEGHEFELKIDHPRENQFYCTISLPIDEHDFVLTSEAHDRKQGAIDETCMTACKLLDSCQLLYSWQSAAISSKESAEKKQRLAEANREDDIELDRTNSKRHCDSSSGGNQKATLNKINTYETLMTKWNDLNMSILQLKAKLVKLDLRVTKGNQESLEAEKGIDSCDGSSDKEVDPLDEFMSTLENKTMLTMDEKIEKSRIKTQIASHEREQSEISRLIELAKPKFDLDKACPPTRGGSMKLTPSKQ